MGPLESQVVVVYPELTSHRGAASPYWQDVRATGEAVTPYSEFRGTVVFQHNGHALRWASMEQLVAWSGKRTIHGVGEPSPSSEQAPSQVVAASRHRKATLVGEISLLSIDEARDLLLTKQATPWWAVACISLVAGLYFAFTYGVTAGLIAALPFLGTVLALLPLALALAPSKAIVHGTRAVAPLRADRGRPAKSPYSTT